MLSKICEDKILFLQKFNDVIYILAENNDNDIVLLNHKNGNIYQIGILDLEYKQIKDVSINFSQNFLGVITTVNKLQIYKISSTLQKLNVSPNSIKGEKLKFDKSGNYLCDYNTSKIYNIWHNKNDKWNKFKIKQSNFLGLLNKFSNNQYYFKKDINKFEVITPNSKFTFTLDKTNIDHILQNKLFIRKEKQKPDSITNKEGVKTVKRFKDKKYILEVFNKESNLFAGVEDRESRIDLWRYKNNNYQFLSTLDKHCGIVKSLCFSNDGEILISGSVTKEIKIWSLKDKNYRVKQTLSEEIAAVIDLQISNDKKTFISIDRENNLIIWKTHKKMHRTGKKKKKKYRDEFYSFHEINNFSYPLNLIKIDNDSLTIRINKESYILFDISNNEFVNIQEINNNLESFRKTQNKCKPEKKVKQSSKDQQTGNVIKPKKSLKTDSEPKKVKTEEDYKINAEIIEFRKNINNISVPEQKKKFFFPIRRKTTEVVDIIVGLDFGTSNTKIVYRRRATNKVKPILFKHKFKKHENYFLPSVVVFNNESELLLGLNAAKYLKKHPEVSGIYNFKMLFVSEIDNSLNNNESIKSMKEELRSDFKKTILQRFNDKKFRFIVISYLSYAMREARNKIKKDLPKRILDISFNVCIPVDYVNSNLVSEEFRNILATAEFIEREYYAKHNNFDFIDLVYKNINYDENNTRVFDIPETVAEVASYTTSSGIKEGLHALIDFGAGTTDISIFNIKNPRQENQKFAFYASNILNYGFRKVDSLKEANEDEKIDKYIKFLWEKSNIAWHNAYNRHLKNDIDWKGDKVQIFISGGGANEKSVSEIFKQPRVNKEKWVSFPHPLRKLPTPEDYSNKKIQFHRFAVAYGLSNPKPKLRISDFLLPKDAPNDTPIPKYKKIYKEFDERIPF